MLKYKNTDDQIGIKLLKRKQNLIDYYPGRGKTKLKTIPIQTAQIS